MAWSAKTKPTRPNARKRLYAAIEALDAAELLLKQIPGEKRSISDLHNGRAWVHSAIGRLESRKGRRT